MRGIFKMLLMWSFSPHCPLFFTLRPELPILSIDRSVRCEPMPDHLNGANTMSSIEKNIFWNELEAQRELEERVKRNPTIRAGVFYSRPSHAYFICALSALNIDNVDCHITHTEQGYDFTYRPATTQPRRWWTMEACPRPRPGCRV